MYLTYYINYKMCNYIFREDLNKNFMYKICKY